MAGSAQKGCRMRRVPNLHVTFGFAVAALLCASFGPGQRPNNSAAATPPRRRSIAASRSAETGVDDSTIRVCPGKAGLVVVVSEDDLRETVSVGRNRAAADQEPAAQTWFGPFNWTTHDGRMADARAAIRLPSSSAGISTTTPMRTRTAGRSQSRCWSVTRLPPGRGVPCRLCRRAGQSQRQRTRPQGRRRVRARFQMRQGPGEGDRRKRPRRRAGGAC